MPLHGGRKCVGELVCEVPCRGGLANFVCMYFKGLEQTKTKECNRSDIYGVVPVTVPDASAMARLHRSRTTCMTNQLHKCLLHILGMHLCTAGPVHQGRGTNCSPEDILDRIMFYLVMKIFPGTAFVCQRLYHRIEHPAGAS